MSNPERRGGNEFRIDAQALVDAGERRAEDIEKWHPDPEYVRPDNIGLTVESLEAVNDAMRRRAEDAAKWHPLSSQDSDDVSTDDNS